VKHLAAAQCGIAEVFRCAQHDNASAENIGGINAIDIGAQWVVSSPSRAKKRPIRKIKYHAAAG